MAEQLEALLWDGRVERVIRERTNMSANLGPPSAGDTPACPRKALSTNVGCFTEHQQHMKYPDYRRCGWPIGSGETEAAVKQFDKPIKRTEQFWSTDGLKSILTLRALWLSQDKRWDRY